MTAQAFTQSKDPFTFIFVDIFFPCGCEYTAYV